MNFKMKALFVAIAMTATGVAQAAIYTDNIGVSATGISSGTGAGELVFSVVDPLRNLSLVLDTNLTVNDFRAGNAGAAYSFSLTDTLLQSFIAGSSDTSQMRWNIGGITNSGFGPNAGIVTTNGSAGATINPGSQGPNSGAVLLSAMSFFNDYANFNNATFTAANPNSSISGAATGAGYLGGSWGDSYGAQLLFSNSQSGFTGTQLVSLIALGSTDVLDFDGVPVSTTFSGKWSVNAATGTVSYVSAVPVPAAIWLLGSGLVGLIGISRRRKQV